MDLFSIHRLIFNEENMLREITDFSCNLGINLFSRSWHVFSARILLHHFPP